MGEGEVTGRSLATATATATTTTTTTRVEAERNAREPSFFYPSISTTRGREGSSETVMSLKNPAYDRPVEPVASMSHEAPMEARAADPVMGTQGEDPVQDALPDLLHRDPDRPARCHRAGDHRRCGRFELPVRESERGA